ncbi:MAG: carbamoyltransferase HypF [Planctomycetia bacterium]
MVTGTVQGVGFRPFVWRLASRHGLSGFVANGPEGVTIELQGETASIDSLITALRGESPPLAEVARIDVEQLPIAQESVARFWIRESDTADQPALSGPAAVPPDIATCPACLAEIRDPTNRRFRHAFTNCTDCGPRFTIIQSLPYDRPRTTMATFPMCPACAAEYDDPADRRFHAQPTACPQCGPIVWFTAADDPGGIAVERTAAPCRGDDAIEAARDRLRRGGLLAIKGMGGFHLVCDATSDRAVARLRERKHRQQKPLAVMVADTAAACRCADVTPQEQLLVESRSRPIVLARKRPDGGGLSAAIAPGNDFVGLMLPCMPLYHLLCEGMPPLVMTSGNRAEEPIAHDNHDAAHRLGPLVDGFLMHDRAIHVPCDDSVVRCAAGASLPIRRSRGHAPLPIRLAGGGPPVLAVGGELKATLCVARDDHAFMSQHLGDMGNLETLAAFGHAADHMMRLFDVVPSVVACDMHPGYLSTEWARRFAAERGIPLRAVQHHEAHVASLLADHAAIDMPLIGVCFDGTGYGRDGTIHGGEVFIAPRGTGGGMHRGAHLEPFMLPGGDTAIRHPWRTALAMLHAAGIEWRDDMPPVASAPPEVIAVVRRQLDTGLACVATTSMGRIFDAVAALAGVKQSISYEAEAAMNLEALAAGANDTGEAYAMPIIAGEPLRIEWRPAVAGIVEDLRGGVDAAVIASRFHRGVAGVIADVAIRLRQRSGINAVGLTGGVFQNVLLARLTVDALHAAGFTVLLHERVPPNDGGLALGQAVIAQNG